MKSDQYVRAIRNPDKRHYAGLWLQFLRGNTYKPSQPKELSVMAAQAVRLRLNALENVP